MRELPHVYIIPNGPRYWVLPDAKHETKIQVGGITLTGENGSKEPPLQGRVVAAGDAPACKYNRSELVIFGKYAGTPHTWEGTDYIILHEDEVLGRVIETPFDPEDPTDLTDC